MKNYYEILNLNRNATTEEIREAYRKLAFKYHPDRNKESDTNERFLEISEAYEILKDSMAYLSENPKTMDPMTEQAYQFYEALHRGRTAKEEA